MRVLVISPHRDDAAFSLTLSIDAWLRAGHSVTVMNCFTRSTYAPFADAASVHANDLLSFVSALRLREDETWRRQRQSAHLHFHDLSLKDAPVRLRCPFEEIFTREVDPNDKAIAAIEKAAKAIGHDVLILPLTLGAHIDHRTAQLALRSAATLVPAAFYEDLPYAAQANITDGIEAYADHLGRILNTVLQPAFAEHANVETAIAKKRKAALCYDSQIETETAEQVAEFCRRYDGAERLWTTPGWNSRQLALTSEEDRGGR